LIGELDERITHLHKSIDREVKRYTDETDDHTLSDVINSCLSPRTWLDTRIGLDHVEVVRLIARAWRSDVEWLEGPRRYALDCVRRARGRIEAHHRSVERPTRDERASDPAPGPQKPPAVPLKLGASHTVKADVWTGEAWIKVPTTKQQHMVLRRLLAAWEAGDVTIDLRMLREISGGAYDVLRKMRDHEHFGRILTPPGTRGNGYGLQMPTAANKQPTNIV
jgi:hypothetical protein